MDYKQIYKPVEKGLADVTAAICSTVKNTEEQELLDLGKFILASPGKKLRSALTLLFVNAYNKDSSQANSEPSVNAAAAVELIHMASLIHDDAIDHTDLRHKQETVNSKWGTEMSIALGDYLYSKSFELISKCNNIEAINQLVISAKDMCEGEILQIFERNNTKITKDKYIKIITNKTASLFSTACSLGLKVADSSSDTIQAAEEFGINFGIAYQLLDDYRDLTGTEDDLGKMPGQDILLGEITLPLILLFENYSEDALRDIELKLSSFSNEERLKKLQVMIKNANVTEQIAAILDSHIKKIKASIASMPESSYKKSINDLVNHVFGSVLLKSHT